MGPQFSELGLQQAKTTVKAAIKNAMLDCVTKYGITPQESQREPEMQPFRNFIFMNTKLFNEWANEVSTFLQTMDGDRSLRHYLNRPSTYRWGAKQGTFMSIQDSVTALEYLIETMTSVDEEMTIQDKLQTLVDIFDMTGPINALLFMGKPKTGKTTLCQMIKHLVGYNFAADLNRMDERGGNTFAFSNLVNKRVIIAEEFATGTDETKLERLKMILGGTPTQTNLKMLNEGGIIHRTPVFMTCNQYPLHPNHEAVHGAAFRRRIIPFNFDNIDIDHLESIMTHACINPFALRCLLEKHEITY